MNYFQRLVRRALARHDGTAEGVVDDPFACEEFWPLDSARSTQAAPGEVVSPALSERGKNVTPQTAATMRPAPPVPAPWALPEDGAPVGAVETMRREASPAEREASDRATGPAQSLLAPEKPAGPPGIAESLLPALSREAVATSDPGLAVADAFMTSFGVSLPRALPSGDPVAPSEPLAAMVNGPPQPGLSRTAAPQNLHPSTPTRSYPEERYSEEKRPTPTGRAPSVPANAPQPAQSAPAAPAPAHSPPVQLVVVQPDSPSGRGSHLGSGAPHFGLGQL